MKLDLVEMLTGSVRRISHIRRYGSLPVIRPENVAEHSYYTALYSYLIATYLQNKFEEVDSSVVSEASIKSLIHDMEEGFSGDVIRTFKYSSPELKSAIDQSSKIFISNIDKSLGLDGVVSRVWSESKDDTLSGNIVRFADLLTVVSYALEESKTGNSYMSEPIAGVTECLEKLHSMFLEKSSEIYDELSNMIVVVLGILRKGV